MDLATRMKLYEGREAKRTPLPRLPVCVRLDGKKFSSWTRGLARPFDVRLSLAMIDTTAMLVEQTGAIIGYTQSDEITLIFYTDDPKSEPWMGGRFQKLASVTASIATAHFNVNVAARLPEKAGRLAYFDARVWTVPSLEEAANVLLWRELDAVKNSISMAAQAVYSHSQLQGKSGSDKQDMLHEKGINWNDYSAVFKRGSYVRRVVVERKLTAEELEKLPPKHDAHKDPDMLVKRSRVQRVLVPPLNRVTNRVAFMLGEDPEAPRSLWPDVEAGR